MKSDYFKKIKIWNGKKWKLYFLLFYLKPFRTRLRDYKTLKYWSAFHLLIILLKYAVGHCGDRILLCYANSVKIMGSWDTLTVNLTSESFSNDFSMCVWKFWIVLPRLMARHPRLSLCAMWSAKCVTVFCLYFKAAPLFFVQMGKFSGD